MDPCYTKVTLYKASARYHLIGCRRISNGSNVMNLRTSARRGWIALFVIAATAQAEEKPAVKDVDPETVAAYQKINGSYSRAKIDDSGFGFQRGHPLIGECLPAFSFGGAGPQGALLDLDVPFCLQF